jgi:hypothetical protein
MFEQQEIKEKNENKVVRTWLAGSCSCTLVISKEFAREYGLDKPSYVILEKKPEGILIRKLEVGAS